MMAWISPVICASDFSGSGALRPSAGAEGETVGPEDAGVARRLMGCKPTSLTAAALQRPRPAHLPATTALSVWMSKVQRSSTSLLATPVTTSTTFCSAPPSNHSARAHG